MSPKPPRRPPDVDYYVDRSDHARQGDIFREVPLGIPWPPTAATYSEGKRKMIAGPFTEGLGMLVSPTCSMAAQGVPGGYAHPLRQIAPVLTIETLLEHGALNENNLALVRSRDRGANYFYLPADEERGISESAALLYAAGVIHHDYLPDQRVAQLSPIAAIWLKRKLAAFISGAYFNVEEFDDDED